MKRLLPFFLILALAGNSYGAGSSFRLHADKSQKTTIVANDIFLLEDSAASWVTKYASSDNIATYVLNKIATQSAFESLLFPLPEGGTGIPGGSEGQVQVYIGGEFVGDAGLVYDPVTNKLTIGGTIESPSVIGTGADGTHYGDFYNGVAITATPTLGRFSGYGGRLYWADGTDWDDYFLLASDINTLIQPWDADLVIAAGAGAAAIGTCYGKGPGGSIEFWSPGGGSGTGIDFVTSDPVGPDTNDVWYNSTDHTLNVREAGGTTKFEGTYTADSAPSGPEFESVAVAVADTEASTIVTATNLVVASGNAIVASVGGYAEGGADITGVTCGSNTLTLGKAILADGSAAGYAFEGWYKLNASAYTGTCTATFAAGSVYRNFAAAAYSGIATSSALDKSTCNDADCLYLSGPSTNLTAVDTETTAVDAELLVFFVLPWDATHTFTAQQGFTRRTEQAVQSSLFDKVVSATGTFPGGTVATIDSEDSYLSIFMTFKAL